MSENTILTLQIFPPKDFPSREVCKSYKWAFEDQSVRISLSSEYSLKLKKGEEATFSSRFYLSLAL